MAKTKTKLITNDIRTYFENDLNEFISDKEVVDIKFSMVAEEYSECIWAALVIYKEDGAE